MKKRKIKRKIKISYKTLAYSIVTIISVITFLLSNKIFFAFIAPVLFVIFGIKAISKLKELFKTEKNQFKIGRRNKLIISKNESFKEFDEKIQKYLNSKEVNLTA